MPQPIGNKRPAAGSPFLKIEGVSKAFPGVLANDNVSFDLQRGEIHALLGENGAGKSTLMGMLFGLHRPDAGRILIDGQELDLSSPRDAINRGLAFVQQHYSLIPALTVLDNIILSQRYGRGTHTSRAIARTKAADVARRYGFAIDLNARVEDLSVAAQQRVELVKALMDDPQVLILDEPTALLSHDDATELWRLLRSLAATGVGIVLIAHKLDEVIAVADRITVLRRGRHVTTIPTSDADAQTLGALMVGDVSLPARTERERGKPGNVALALRSVTVGGEHALPAARDIDFEVREGEILGIGGVVGAGQVELLEAIAGVRRCWAGAIYFGETDITSLAIRGRQRLGVGYIPPDRRSDGLVGPLSVADNLALAADGVDPAVSRYGVLNPGAISAHAERSIARFDIRCSGMSTPCSKLSGGNQQKVILARELSRRPKVVLCCYPTRGLDFAATAAVHAELRAAAAAGAAVVVVSLDLSELLELADRVLVMQGGRIRGGGATTDLTEEKLGLLIGGERAA